MSNTNITGIEAIKVVTADIINPDAIANFVEAFRKGPDGLAAYGPWIAYCALPLRGNDHDGLQSAARRAKFNWEVAVHTPASKAAKDAGLRGAVDAYPLEGQLYSFIDENGEEQITFDCLVGATLSDGTKLIHKAFYANARKIRNTREIAQRFADKIKNNIVIDLAYWEPYVDNSDSLEERLHGYAMEEQAERHGYAVSPWR